MLPHNPGGNIAYFAYFFFFDDTDIPLRRLPAGSTDSLAESDFIRIYTHYFVMEFLK